MENLHLAALINSYWYFHTLRESEAFELNRINLTNLLNRAAWRIRDIMEGTH